ncbi:30S ribosomal protein THX [Pukyongia salina]|uniref:30S ribosomal protein THX n=1 Tax=Pukyongia salina TaxID=2094025 RepID=A0A2S0HUX7_9FLAO|nr:30S ribosomal protein THX [Pukyongia salina]AVI49973.1 30S ribosomal protein THX [Pukyongia salina]
MGKGDKKTKRGKIVLGTFGKLRPRRRKFTLRPTTIKNGQPREK